MKAPALRLPSFRRDKAETPDGQPLSLVLGTPPKERTSGAASIPVNRMSTGSMYAVANRRVVSHAVPMVGYLKGAPLRSPLDLSFAFASEQTIDELAVIAKIDPLEFRRNNIGDARWLGVLNAAAEAAGWKPRVAGSSLSADEVVSGRGIGLGSFAGSQSGAVADIAVVKETGKIRVLHAYSAQVSGLGVSLEGLESQMMGSLMMGTSRTLYESVAFDTKRVTGLDWVTYPILRFKDHPTIHYKVVQRLDLPPSGAGEPPVADLHAPRVDRPRPG